LIPPKLQFSDREFNVNYVWKNWMKSFTLRKHSRISLYKEDDSHRFIHTLHECGIDIF